MTWVDGSRLTRPWADPDALRSPAFRRLILVVTGVLLVLAAASAVQIMRFVLANDGGLGVDFHQYEDHVDRWLRTGQLYLPHQLAGPTEIELGDPLYPPPIVLLLLPYRVVPDVVWWIVPLTVLGWTLVRLRPAPWTWPILALIALWPRTVALIAYGNPGMWIDAFIALALWAPWAGPLVLLKPSLAPLALIGVRRRVWWLGLAALLAISVPFAGLWVDYLAVVRNSSTPLTYSLFDLPLALAPVIAFVGRTREFDGSTRRA